MSFSVQTIGGRSAHLFARSNADFTRGAVGVPGIDRKHSHVSAAALEMTVADGYRSSFHAVGCEHSRAARGMIGNGDSKVEIAARFQSGFNGGKTEAARKRIFREQGNLNHVRFY